jgi:[protein-PII] uridylyltransferase
MDGLLPEWERVRLLPHASAVHRFTVDRHLVQTCVEAATLAGRTTRPDLLLVAALMHDIGKGDHGDHSDAGAPVAEDVARRIGFCEQDAARVGRLVRHHLLLSEAATAHDPADPTTVRRVTAVVGDREELRLLSALTEADARATGGQAWTRWRAALVDRLVEQCAAVLP